MTARPQATPAHTPGPWKVTHVKQRDAHGPGRQKYIGPGNDAADVCLTTGHDNCEMDEANARLIAQAPALLAALEQMAEEFQYHNPGGTTKPQGEALAAAQAAIAAARGQS